MVSEETNEMIKSLTELRDKVMLAHACTIDSIEKASVLVFLLVIRCPA